MQVQGNSLQKLLRSATMRFNAYKWEAELADSSFITDGKIPKTVRRISYIPDNFTMPRHDLFFSDFKFVSRFTRTFMLWNGEKKECLHCVITSAFRFYLFSSTGSTLVTPVSYDLYL